ncbi:ATP-binding cassette transporter-like protein [Streptococcus cristatus]|uniref:ABC transporter ATP-binding protein n=2 Tax=Streptococcus cristatus TaxID=45634 RepID=A0A512AAV5_STRCR|nr:efflux RND transporter periplasmic adaptor subunit [Streptococcus cristatus]AGK70699.1 ATP-binding cassette transporter-like protein [Streptococcus cristatus AS 1.3089]GEN96838.1 ABC transporter ATP-binding protein [Streptococcus cristatus]SQI46610.1 ATP-binding cassette transporter-like protein [Streptococcus cristatus]
MFERKKMNRKTIILGSTVILACAGLGGYVLLNQVNQKQAMQMVDNKIDSLTVQDAVNNSKKTSLVLSGEVVANNSSKVKIDPSKGEVKEVFVKNGDTVTQGQPLFSYVTSQELTAQSAQYDAQAKANGITTAQTSASIKWETYNRKLASLNALRNKYNSSKDESLLDQIKSAEDELAQALSDAKTADNEVTNAQIEAEKAQVTAQTESDRMKYDTVTADTAGTITSMNEDLPTQSKAKKEEETFIEIMDKSKTLVKGTVSEFDREKLSVGQRVDIVDRKDPKKRWSGTVTQVGTLTTANAGNSNGGNKQQENPNQGKFPYTVELDQGGEMPLVGSHSYVNVVENAPEAGKVVVNKAYTFSKNGKTYVWKVEGKKVKMKEVKTKKVSDRLVEITEGLTMQDTISTPREGMKDGMEVGQNVKA